MCAERCVAHNGDKRFINNISEKYIKSIKTLKGFAHISTHAFCWLRCHVRCRYLGKLFVSDDEIRSRKALSWMRHYVAACSSLNILLGSSVKTFIFMLRKKLPRNTIGSGTNSDARRIPADADTQQNVSFSFSLRIYFLSRRARSTRTNVYQCRLWVSFSLCSLGKQPRALSDVFIVAGGGKPKFPFKSLKVNEN